MRFLLLAGLLTAAAAAQDEEPGFTWTGRVRLSLAPEQIAAGLAKQPAEARQALEKLLFGDWIDTKICSPIGDAQITYRNLDEDDFDEAILDTGSCMHRVFLILDRDQSGWWLVGRRAEDVRRGGVEFRIMNWPTQDSPTSFITHGTWDSGTGTSGYGITVFRLSRSSLRVVFRCGTFGYRSATEAPMNPPRSVHEQTFFRTAATALTIARRSVLLPRDERHSPTDDDYRLRGTVLCEQHRWDPARQIYSRPARLSASACTNVWNPLGQPFLPAAVHQQR